MDDLNRGITEYLKKDYISFHVPGHKGRRDLLAKISFPAGDVTELPGLDQLQAPQGVIAQAQRRAAAIFGADESFFLVNGGTVGNQAMLLSIAGEKPKRVLLERQAHRSVSSGLILSGLTPEYLWPVLHPDFNLCLGLDVEQRLLTGKDIQACHLTYPNYYGAAIHLERMMAWRDAECPALPMLIDQAHGAHYLNECFPTGALALGADLVTQSAHKTLGALTQAALLHRRGSRVRRLALKQALDVLQTSSPSYLLMASLESAVELAGQKQYWEGLREEVEKIHAKVGGFLRLLGPADEGKYGIWQVDWSKILVNTRPLGVPAAVCVDYLRRRFRIEPELWDEENILFVLGIGNTPREVELLRRGLESLLTKAFQDDRRAAGGSASPFVFEEARWLQSPPSVRMTPREAFLAPKREVPLADCPGQICGETVALYPPGIPLIMMGEEITREIVEMLVNKRKASWQGWSDAERQTLRIIDG